MTTAGENGETSTTCVLISVMTGDDQGVLGKYFIEIRDKRRAFVHPGAKTCCSKTFNRSMMDESRPQCATERNKSGLSMSSLSNSSPRTRGVWDDCCAVKAVTGDVGVAKGQTVGH